MLFTQLGARQARKEDLIDIAKALSPATPVERLKSFSVDELRKWLDAAITRLLSEVG